MRVRRDFDAIYAAERDPWQIGDAASSRYDLYRDLILRHAAHRARLLDIGSGLGAFLARFEDEFAELVGVDVSSEAVARAAELNGDARFLRVSAESLSESELDAESFDAIVYSDVIYYLEEAHRRSSLAWIARHLVPGGVALIAAWCPGGNYLTRNELRSLVSRDFRILEEVSLESEHAAFVVERKRRLVALTFDYETWQPIPDGRRIDWDKDVFEPADALLAACDEEGATITLFAEVGEYLWLLENDAPTAERMAEQWRDAVRRGHDVQLHLHPSWLPELGARWDGDGWHWDPSIARADDYPGDLVELIARCKRALEDAVGPADPTYQVTCFRAGAYQAQPFRRLGEALARNGIFADSSVYAGGVSRERGYDYSLAYSTGQPHFANMYDPQLKAPPSESDIVELPILTFAPSRRWMLDGDEGADFGHRLIAHLEHLERRRPTTEWRRRRLRVQQLAGAAYSLATPLRRAVNVVTPRAAASVITSYTAEHLVSHDYFVAIGHTKGDLRVADIARELQTLRADGRFELLRLSELARVARAELEHTVRDPTSEAEFQVAREYTSVLGPDRNDAQSHLLQERIPLDRDRVLDLGCGAGYWSARIANLYPWMHLVGVDVGKDFIEAASRQYASERVRFEQADFTQLPFADATFDCVYADNTLEHAFDVDASLAEVHRVLEPGGVLVAAIPADARNPSAVCDNHTWKTAPAELRARLANAGFHSIEIDEVDTYRRLGLPPYPPSNDTMMYVRAWKRPTDVGQLARALEAMDWLYRRLDPERPHESNDAIEIIAGGHAFCAGSAVALGTLIEREGVDTRWVTMEASDHVRGRGEDSVDTHVVVSAKLDGTWMLLDAMANTVIPHSLAEVLAEPGLAGQKENPDERYEGRGYQLYDTEYWYSRVRRSAVYRSPNPKIRLMRRNRHRHDDLSGAGGAASRS